jgi:Zn-dependent protease with chaperone function
VANNEPDAPKTPPSTPKKSAKKAAQKRVDSGASAKQTPKNTAKALPQYDGLSVAAFQHPADRAATAALTAIPGLDKVVRWLIEQGYERALYQQNLAASVRLGTDQLANVYALHLQVVQTLDLPNSNETPPSLYIAQNPTLNAMTVGSQNPYIVLTSRLVEVLDADELQAVIGHEVGHILSSHVVYHTALQILLNLSLPVLSPGALPLTAVRLALLEWFRAAELTCDRAAVLAVDDPELVCRTMMVLGGGLPSSQLSFAAFMRQVQEYQQWEDGPDRLRRFLASLNQTHGSPVRRSAEIVRWVESGEFDRIRSGQYTRRGEEAGALSATSDAVTHYSNSFRDIFNSAGESVAKAGSKFQTWIRGLE